MVFGSWAGLLTSTHTHIYTHVHSLAAFSSLSIGPESDVAIPSIEYVSRRLLHLSRGPTCISRNRECREKSQSPDSPDDAWSRGCLSTAGWILRSDFQAQTRAASGRRHGLLPSTAFARDRLRDDFGSDERSADPHPERVVPSLKGEVPVASQVSRVFYRIIFVQLRTFFLSELYDK